MSFLLRQAIQNINKKCTTAGIIRPLLCNTINNNLYHSTTVSRQKQSTGITGIPVVTNAREVGIGLLKDTLNKLDTYGSDSNYNKLCRKICQYRLSVFEKYTNVEDIEQHIHEGQIEELLIEMEEEYDLMIQINENPEFKEALESVGEEQAAEWKHYNDPIGANTTLTFVTPEMLRQLHDEEFEKSIWEEIDKELDEEGIPRLPKQTIDEKVLKQYADNAAL